MKSFHEIVTSDPKSGERAVKLLREYFYCQYCAFNDVANKNKACQNCKEVDMPLLTSLDPWIPLWERMTPLQRVNYNIQLNRIRSGAMYGWDFRAPHYTEAALYMLEVECPECGGDYKSYNPSYPDCTCNAGKRTLYELWKIKNKEEA